MTNIVWCMAYKREVERGGCILGTSHAIQILALTLLHIHTLPGGDALVRALCPVALRAGLLRAAWRTALCAWRWRKAGSYLPHSSFVFSKRKLQKLCVGRWGPVSL